MTANTFSASWDDAGPKTIKVNTLPNPAKDSVGKAITVKTDEDVSSNKVNDVVTTNVKYTGDMPKPGIIVYINNVVLSKN